MFGVSMLEYYKEFFKAAIKRKQLQMHLKMLSESCFDFIQGNHAGRTDYERSALSLSSSVATKRKCYQ